MHWEFGHNLGSEKIAKVEHKSEDISESVCSFHSGSTFCPSLGHEISRNAFVVSILFPGRFSYGSTAFFIPRKIRDFHEILTFLRNCQEASWKLLGGIRNVLECIRVRMTALEKRNGIYEDYEFRDFSCL